MSGDRQRLLADARQLLPETVALRRRIHRHPELGNHLPETKQAVLDAIGDLDLKIAHSQSTSGLVATLIGAGPGPTILLRGDMDALPMPEDTGLDYASEVDGRMHACGHDSHTAMLAMAARLLCRRRDDLRGRVMFMFQPGEEGPGGAKPMLDEGLLDADGPPDAAFALHIFPNLPSGVLASRPGRVLAAADRVRVTLTGQGGHGSMPHLANDPVPVACELVQAMQTLVTRRFDIFDPVVLTVGRIAAGTVNNVVPETAVMDATLRSFSAEARGAAHDGLRRLADGVAAAHGMTAEVKIAEGYPPTVNDGDFFAFLAGSARNLLGEDAFQEMPNPVMGAEDFSYVLQRVPGAMAFLGVAPEGSDPATAAPCHSNRMLLDEDAMAVGVATHAAVALDFLARG